MMLTSILTSWEALALLTFVAVIAFGTILLNLLLLRPAFYRLPIVICCAAAFCFIMVTLAKLGVIDYMNSSYNSTHPESEAYQEGYLDGYEEGYNEGYQDGGKP